jgi:hypothetical protein
MVKSSNESNLPDRIPASRSGRTSGGQYLSIENFHYTTNDLTELRKLAEVNAELAHKVVESQTKATTMRETSERIGIVVAGTLAMTAVVGFVVFVVKLGWWQSIVFVLVLLGISHVLRTILTGKWSETSWFGAFLKARGGRSDSPDEDQ